jgi:hypothetical protein
MSHHIGRSFSRFPIYPRDCFLCEQDKHAEDDASSTRSRGKGKKHAPSSHSQDIADGSALILRVHHVLSDGLALVAFMDAITEEWYVRPHSRARTVVHGSGRPGTALTNS